MTPTLSGRLLITCKHPTSASPRPLQQRNRLTCHANVSSNSVAHRPPCTIPLCPQRPLPRCTHTHASVSSVAPSPAASARASLSHGAPPPSGYSLCALLGNPRTAASRTIPGPPKYGRVWIFASRSAVYFLTLLSPGLEEWRHGGKGLRRVGGVGGQGANGVRGRGQEGGQEERGCCRETTTVLRLLTVGC